MSWRLGFLVAFVFSLGIDAHAAPRQVSVEGGKVAGVPARDASITVFKGIPYAAPPVGDLRWRAPQPVVPWHGVRQANTFGHSCVQPIVGERKPWTYEFMTHNEVSEDCLYLNVWTPAASASERLPVYVYIYGGANREGSGAVPVYDGEGLARKGIVFVTVNYRLGVFGFLTHPELTRESERHVSGNYAILDLVAALKWVKANIAAFGGDPAKVTIGGQSAGASNTHALTASPLARGLFRGAIAQSGSSVATLTGTAMRTLEEQERLGVEFAQRAGATSLAELRKLPWKDLLATQQQTESSIRLGTVVDGYVLPARIGEIFARGEQNDVPTITGCNMHENGASPNPETTVDEFRKAASRYDDLAGEFLALYPAASDEQARAAQNESAWDAARTSMYLWAVTRGKTAKTRAFTYFWDHTLPGPDAGKYGAFHSSEVPYVMNALGMSDRPFTADDHRIADMLSSYWANFVATGDPNGKGLAHWPAVGEQPGTTMRLGDRVGAVPVAGSKARHEFFEKFLSRPRPARPPG